MSLAEIEGLIKKNGFERFGTTPIKAPRTIGFYKEWLKDGFHADMNYLKDHLIIKEDPARLLADVQSSIVVAETYYPHPRKQNSTLRTALYAQGEDYHFWLQSKLNRLKEDLSQQFLDHQFLCFTDSAPVLERELAYLSGLGWVGKNTCVIHPKFGSLFFIGEIYTTLELPASAEPLPDFCGTCDRCIRACPTGALAPKKLDSNRCIAYWNIESKDVAPEGLREKVGDWFFGCDICQTVCPWNEKVFGQSKMQELTTPKVIDRVAIVNELREILLASNKELMRRFQKSPQSRARGRGLKKNALVVIANLKLHELEVDVQTFLGGDLSNLAQWVLRQLH